MLNFLRFSRLLGMSAALALTSSGAWAQQGNIDLKVTDQQTGFAIGNATAEVVNPTGRTERLASRSNGKLALRDREGEITFRISAPGYAPLTTHFKAGGEVPQLDAEVQLDPLPKPGAGRPTAQRMALAPNQTLVEGYVSDREQGTPLTGVTVHVGSATAVSDASGYYRVMVSSPGQQTEEFVKQTTDVTFSKAGYVSYQMAHLRLIGDDYTFKTSLQPATPGAAQRGAAPVEIEESYHGFFDKTGDEPGLPTNQDAQPTAPAPASAGRAAAVTLPTSIRVGTSCPTNQCSAGCSGPVQVMSLEAYVRSGLESEWISSWGVSSLRAGAVAYRSYGAYYALHPVKSTYDISSNTCHQVWNSAIVASTRDAADFTAGVVLTKNGVIARSEYSAENNNAGCGDGYAGTNTASGPCIADALCVGKAKFGHGRGMCQWGSSRWSTNGKSYEWILNHYYNPAGVIFTGGSPSGPSGPAVAALDIVSGGVYRLTSKLTGLRVDAAGAGQVDDTDVIQYAANENNAQKWVVTQEQDGSYKLTHLGTSQCLTARDNQPGSLINTFQDNGNSAQQRWDIVRYADGFYKLVHKGTNQVLDVPGGDKTAGRQLIQYDDIASDAQRWGLELVDLQVRSGGTYTLTHQGTNPEQRLTVDGNSPYNGANVYQWQNQGTTNAQFWIITTAGGGYYRLRHRGTDQYLDVAGANPAPLADVVQHAASGSDAQLWQIVPTGGGYIKLVSKLAGHCLAVLNNSNQNQAEVVVDTDNGTPSQRWRLQLTGELSDGRPEAPALAPALASASTNASALAESAALRVYPNPAQGGQIQLAFVAPATGLASLALYNHRGQRVRQRTLPAQAGVAAHATLGAEQLPAGLYTLRLSLPGAPPQNARIALNP